MADESEKERAAAVQPDMERYSRQMRFAPIGPDGQRRLLGASVLIVGAGALGASLAQHMARAGVGRIRIVDRDFVEPSNLQRQTLFDEEDARLALPKAAAAAAKLRRINSGIVIEEHIADVTAENAAALADGVQLVLDGTDNAATRLLMSDVCFARGIPFVYGGVLGASGMSAVLVPGETACLRCLVGGESEAADSGTCETEGVISPAVELVTALQAAEALKWLAGRRDALRRTWVSASLWPFQLREWRLPSPSPHCPVCGAAKPAEADGRTGYGRAAVRAKRNAEHTERTGAGVRAEQAARRAEQTGAEASRAVYSQGPGAMPNERAADDAVRTAVLCGRDAVQLTLAGSLPLGRIEEQLTAAGHRITRNPWLFRVEMEDGRRIVFFRGDARVLVQGAAQTDEAVRGLAELLDTLNLEGVTVR